MPAQHSRLFVCWYTPQAYMQPNITFLNTSVALLLNAFNYMSLSLGTRSAPSRAVILAVHTPDLKVIPVEESPKLPGHIVKGGFCSFD